jgi:hypothetical protein
MSTNHAVNRPLHGEPVFAALEIRELSLLEMQQVAGGSPNSTWLVVETNVQTAGQYVTASPNNSW